MKNDQNIIMDSCISNIYFHNSKSVTKMVGDLSQKLTIRPNFLPQVGVLNNTNNQYLILSAWPGDGKNEFRYFKIGFINTLDKEINYVNKSDINFFETCEGIKLGIKKKKLIALLGNNYTEYKEESNEILLYEYSDYLYQAKYTFFENQLCEFEFGYLYP